MTVPKAIHFVGVGGVGTGTLAVELAKNGFQVSGTDRALYEPMRSVLTNSGVKIQEGFGVSAAEAANVDLVIIGNVITKENEEAQFWMAQGKPFISFPEAVRKFLIQDKRSVVVAGTHGKTTTTCWIAYLFEKLGFDPSYLLGGVPQDLSSGGHLSQGTFFVGEGDEYDSAFFDKGPKFLHYNPEVLVLTSIDFDHADIYRDIDHIKAQFRKLVALLPGDGLCVARFEAPNVMDVVRESLCPVQTFGTSESAMWSVRVLEETTEGYRFEVLYKKKVAGIFSSPMLGEYNLMNLLSGIVCAANFGATPQQIQPILESFHGVRRRQERLLKEPVVLIDDFAHHPVEVKATLRAIRNRYREGSLWALFEPRSATARTNVHQEEYVEAFDSADHILVSQPHRATEVDEQSRFSAKKLASALVSKGKNALAFEGADAIFEHVRAHYKKGDVIATLSNGEFAKLQVRLKEALEGN